MKYVFLDIDGVLWTVGWSIYARRVTNFGHTPAAERYRKEYEEWCPIASSNLQWVIEQGAEQGVDVRIVVSSTWRLSRTLDELKDIAKKSGINPDMLIGVTPKLPSQFDADGKYYRSAERGTEIQAWMDANNVVPEQIVIIDDDSDMAHLRDRLVLTDAYDGLGFRKALEVAQMIGIRDK